MNKSYLIHGAWALVAITAFAIGNRDQSATTATESAREKAARSNASTSGPSGLTSTSPASATARIPGASDDASSSARAGLSANQIESISATAFSDPNPLNRSLAFSKLLEGLTPENAELVLQTLTDGDASRDQWRLFLYAWGTQDGAGALDYAAANLEGDRLRRFQSEALTGWASQNPDDAIAWASGIEDEGERNRMNYSLVSGLADHDINLATDYTLRLATEGNTYASRYLDSVATEQIRKAGIEGAITWGEALPDGDLKGSALDRIAGNYVNRDPEAAAAWAAQFATADYGSRIIEEIGDEWAERNPEASVGWLGTLPHGDGRNQGTYSAFREWAQRDAMAASEHLVDMPDSPARDHAASGLARSISGKDPESAIAWANTISEPDLRTSTLTRTARDWFFRDRDSATAWLATSGLSPEAQAEVTAPRTDRRRRG